MSLFYGILVHVLYEGLPLYVQPSISLLFHMGFRMYVTYYSIYLLRIYIANVHEYIVSLARRCTYWLAVSRYYSAHFFLHFPLQPNAHHMAQTAMEQDERLIKVTLRVYVFSKLLICVFLHRDL